MTAYDFDLITIGAGSGGVRASRVSSALGAKVAIVENFRVGGTCVMRGCVPKKLLVYGSQFAEHFADSVGFGWSPEKNKLDWPALISAKNNELSRLEKVYQDTLRSAGVTLLEGKGRVVAPNEVDVNGKTWSAKYILLATGGWPALPNIPGIKYAITSNEALELGYLPKSIILVGGGYIAVEFAGIFNALGTEVHLIIRAPNILRGFDGSIREALNKELLRKGVIIHSGANVISIKKYTLGPYETALDTNTNLQSDTVMFATGRHPNTKQLGLEKVNVLTDDKGAIVVDGHSKTSRENIFAIGDATNRVNLTPVALAEGNAVANTLFGKTAEAMDYRNVPSAVFSQPPIACVGLSEEEAQKIGPVDIYFSSFRPMKNTLSNRDELSVMKLVVNSETDKVVGCHMMGQDAPEIIQGLAIAIKCGATKAQFDSTIGIHPTSAEEFVTMREKLR